MSKAILLTKGKIAFVDDSDFLWLKQWKWYAQKNAQGRFYAARREGRNGPLIYMHRLINETPDGYVTDHIDGNGLNNQRLNLRTATQRENMMNRVGKLGGSSRFKGVWADSSPRNRKPWRAAIRLDGCLKYLGRFEREEDAAAAYALAAKFHFGDFARTNKRSSK